jgi:hypothetical protein
MNKKSHKLIAFAIFLIIVLGSGSFFFNQKIKNHKTIKKAQYRTLYNPRYLDSMVRAKKRK